MTKRAFIIAIENYTQMQESLGVSLANTHQHAVEFREWLIDVQKLAPGDIFFCTEDPGVNGRTDGATRTAIKDALKRFQKQFKDQTGDLYFYFSGHGLCYTDVDDVPTADVLIGSDYAERSVSGDACLKLDEIQKWLKQCLGSVTDAGSPRAAHYYFIDACRNLANEKEIKVAPLGLTYDFSNRKKAPVFTLYSASIGAATYVGSGFHDALIEGLKGKGKAKRWYEKTLAILFDSLCGYIEHRLGTELDPRIDGGGDGLIREIPKPWDYSCTIKVKDATAADRFQFEVKNNQELLVKSHTFKGPIGSFKLPAEEYSVQVRLTSPGAGVIQPDTPQSAELYDDCTLEFRKAPNPPVPGPPRGGPPGPRGPTGPILPPSLNVLPPAGARIIVHGTSFNALGTGTLRAFMSPGKYTLETHDLRGIVVDRRRVTVKHGETNIDLTQLHQSPLRASLLQNIPGRHNFLPPDGTVEFSESIGPMPDQGLDLWLALIGAARIVGGNDDFSKLSPLPLANFDNVGPNQSAFYLLAGFDEPNVRLQAVVAEDWRATPVPVKQHPGFPGLFELALPSGTPGSRYVTVQVDDNASTTFCTCMLPMRGTLVTLSRGHSKDLRIQQFILPLKQFQQQLPYGSGLWIDQRHNDLENPFNNINAPLRLVRRCVEAQRAFARGQDLDQVMNHEELKFLLYFKWFEPIIALMSAYELVRRGKLESLPEVVKNLRSHFHGLPDTEALSKLAGKEWNMPETPPLLLEGFQALNLMAQQLDFPSANIPPSDTVAFRGPWNIWRGLADVSQAFRPEPTGHGRHTVQKVRTAQAS
jgi:Caspase domain